MRAGRQRALLIHGLFGALKILADSAPQIETKISMHERFECILDGSCALLPSPLSNFIAIMGSCLHGFSIREASARAIYEFSPQCGIRLHKWNDCKDRGVAGIVPGP